MATKKKFRVSVKRRYEPTARAFEPADMTEAELDKVLEGFIKFPTANGFRYLAANDVLAVDCLRDPDRDKDHNRKDVDK